MDERVRRIKSSCAYAATDGYGNILPNTVADSVAAVRLKLGKWNHLRVRLIRMSPVRARNDTRP